MQQRLTFCVQQDERYHKIRSGTKKTINLKRTEIYLVERNKTGHFIPTKKFNDIRLML